MKTKKLLSLVLLGILCSVGNVWATDLVVSNTTEVSETFADGSILYSIDSNGRVNSSTKFGSGKDIISGGSKTKGAALVDSRFAIKFPVAVSNVTIYGYNSSSGRALNNVYTSTTMEKSSYTNITSSTTKNSSSSTPNYSYTFTASWATPIVANTAIWFAFNNSCNFYKISYTAASTDPAISAENVNIAASATGGSIEYSISNSVDGGVVTAAEKDEADWLTLGAVSDEAVAFITTTNSGAEREATVTLTYTYGSPSNTVSKDVTITQAGPTFSITKGIHSNGDFSISPNPAGLGSTVTLSATPSTGYAFAGWQIVKTSDSEDVTGLVSLSSAVSPSATFTMPAYDVTINATFVAPNIYYYKDATHYDGASYKNPEGETAASSDDQSLSSPWAICNECVTGVTSVIAKGCTYDGKSNHMNAYIKVPTGGDKDNKNISFTIADGYKAFLKIKMGGYSSNPSITLKKLTAGSLGDNIAYSGTVDGVATTEDNFKELIWTLPSAGTYVLNVTTKNAYISQIDIQTDIVSVTKTITDAGWATYCSPYALDFSSSIDHLEDAFIVTGGADGILAKTSVMGGSVPANTGLLLKGEGECVIPVAASSSTDVSANKLEGKIAEYSLTANGGYVLMATPSLGFYLNANAFTVGANTAYLPVGFDGGASAPSLFRIVEEGQNATNIENVKTNDKVVKFIENGRIIILRDGITYDALGRVIR